MIIASRRVYCTDGEELLTSMIVGEPRGSASKHGGKRMGAGEVDGRDGDARRQVELALDDGGMNLVDEILSCVSIGAHHGEEVDEEPGDLQLLLGGRTWSEPHRRPLGVTRWRR